jgi:glycosyltransferase involved in cell wall biosynthesis
MNLLFVKERLAWPRSSGHDVHCYHMMRALSHAGHDVSLATLHNPEPEAVDNAGLESIHHLTDYDSHEEPLALTKTQERFRSYWGAPVGTIKQVARLSRDLQAQAVIVVGINVLPYLAAVKNAIRVWYAGDESVLHHLSQFQCWDPSTWRNLKQAAVQGLYERTFRSILDRVWMVSKADRTAYQWVTGFRNVDVLPNGIDNEYYAPIDVPVIPRSCIFWGRLDFGPNIQALQWFCHKVWPGIRRRIPDASFTICGFQPTHAVDQLIKNDQGVTLLANLPDIRTHVARHEVVVLPFVSGGGIKNKLLEAAAMGKPIVCSPRTVRGLTCGDAVARAARARHWAPELAHLWRSAERRAQLGSAARRWVVEQHTWESTANRAADALRSTVSETIS